MQLYIWINFSYHRSTIFPYIFANKTPTNFFFTCIIWKGTLMYGFVSAIKNKLYFIRINKLFLVTYFLKNSKTQQTFYRNRYNFFSNFSLHGFYSSRQKPFKCLGPMDKWKEVLISQPQRYKKKGKKRIKPTFFCCCFSLVIAIS